MAASNYKIGQIASRLGISVRTLRHYDAIGLLRPSSRTATGQRLYTGREITRLQKIVALRRMGFSLDHVRTILSGDVAQAYAVLDARASQLREQVVRQQDILRRVEAVLGTPATQQAAPLRRALVREMQRGSDPREAHVQALVQQLDSLARGVHQGRYRMENFEVNLFSYLWRAKA